MRPAVPALLVSVLMVAAACGGDGSESDGDGGGNGATLEVASCPEPAAESGDDADEDGSGNGGSDNDGAADNGADDNGADDNGAGQDQGEARTYADGAGEGIDSIAVSGRDGEQPELEFEQPFEVSETTTKVLSEGDGPAVEEGQTVIVDYAGINARNGEEFDSSWSRGQTAPFPMDPAGMIEGFVTGLVGQNIGSRVLVAIPSEEGYAEGNPDAGIEQGDTLLFVVDLHDVQLEQAEGEPVEQPADVPTVQTNDAGRPTGIQAPDSDAPGGVHVAPIICGDGPRVTAEDTVQMHYLASLWRNDEVFDNSWEPRQEGAAAQPAGLPLANMPEQGLAEGIVGHSVGSRVLIVLPANQLIPDEQQQEQLGIQADDTVNFVVDILSVG